MPLARAPGPPKPPLYEWMIRGRADQTVHLPHPRVRKHKTDNDDDDNNNKHAQVAGRAWRKLR